MKPIIYIILSFMILSFSGSQAHAQNNQDNAYNMKYQDMDQNNDGKITREEWQAYFNNHDWNGDGVLSGNEMKPGARRGNRWGNRWQTQTTSTNQFRALDSNNDGAISANEWPGNMSDFNRLDLDHNGNLSVNEFYQRLASDQFNELDDNNDGVITYEEWSPNSRRSFDALDLNHDGRLTRDEFYNPQQLPVSAFRELDQNNDGRISRSEWRGTSNTFNSLDANGDGFLTENEFNSTISSSQGSSVAVQILQEIFRKR